MNHRRRLDDLDASLPRPAPAPVTFAERVAAILLHVRSRWLLSTKDAVHARKLKPGAREELPTRDELMTWDDVPRAQWGVPPHLGVQLIDPLTLYAICTSGELRIVEIVAEAFAEQPAERPSRARQWRRAG